LVDTQRPEEPEDASWEEVGDASQTMADHLSHKLYTLPDEQLTELAQGLRTDRPLETARRIMERTHGALTYMRGVTSVHTSAHEAFVDGAGVCQDFAHLALSLTKSVGLPSRYVSGYFHPETDAIIGEEITGESHAWVEVWTGSWWAYDPTNDCPIGERHVAIGRGRDYSDVPPVKGIYAGNAEHTMQVGVRITRTH
jgi:transglutaminase-like putative cysteine protease